MLTRLEAMQDISLGRGIQLRFVGQDLGDGRTATFNIILRKKHTRRSMPEVVEAVIECKTMRRTYYVTLTAKQVLAYIKRHYPRLNPTNSDIITLNHMEAA